MPLKIMLQSDSPVVNSGYGQTTRLLIEIFRKLHHQVAIFAYYGIEGTMMQWNGLNVYGRGNEMYGNDIIEAHVSQEGSDIVVTNIDPFVLQRYGDRNFAWVPLTPVAGDPLAPAIKNALRRAVDVVAISQFSQEILQEGGVPATHIYLPVATNFYHPLDRERVRAAFPWGQSDAYVIGHVGMNRGYRKGHDILFRAFQMFLGEVPHSLLYMHTDIEQQDGLNLRELILEMGLEGKVLYPSRYEAFTGKSPYWMNGLYNALDLYVQPSLNEGQGMTVFEAAAVGQPIVATDATSLSEIIQDMEAIPVQWRNKVRMPMGCWGYEVTADDLADAMYQAYRKWGKGYVSLKNRQIAIEKVSMEQVSHQWYEELLKVEKMVRYTPISRPWRERPKVVQVSTRAYNCGIGNYTRALMASMSDATEQECIDIIEMGKDNIKVPPCDIVSFHFENSIWPSDDIVRHAIMDAKYRGAKVICIYHTIQPETIAYHLKHRIVDMAVIHWPILGAEIKDARIWVLGGMGCPTYYVSSDMTQRDRLREKYGFSSFDTIISTFGFASVGRGHWEVLEQLAPLLRTDPHLKMQLILSENFLNKSGYTSIHDTIQRIAEDYGIKEQVIAIPHFLPDVEVLDRLWMSDVGFLYFGGHTLSSSAAIRYFISARLPVVISPTSHFEDVRRGVIRTGSFSLPEFSRTVWETAQNKNLLNRLRTEHNATYQQFQWPVFGESYLSIYKKVMNG